MARPGKIAVVMVHGTGDTAPGLDGQKWFQRGSAFSEGLRQRLGAAGLEAEIHPVLWSGANSAAEREKGAEKLAEELKRCRGRYDSVHVIGHSHGGNVANEAAVFLRWGQKRGKAPIDSLITVGTPFFNVRTGWLQRIAGMLFLALTWGSAIMIPFLALFMWYTPAAREDGVAMLVALGVFALCTLFMLSISRRGARRINRPRRVIETGRPILSIWHENDEAISFLKRVEELPIEPFPKGAMFRGSRTAAISWGVLAVILVGAAFPLMYMMGLADVFGIDDTASGGRGVDMFASAAAGLVFAPAVFVLVYWFYRWVIGGVAEVGVRGPVNGIVSGALRGMAMGRDGDQVLCDVSTESHTHKTESRKLEGEVAQRMQTAAGAAADKLIDKYRWSLFTVGVDTNAPLTNLATDAMTWDSLIHTTYFDQPEVADLIAAHIVERARSV
jgi:hypothetical protein